LPSKRSGHVPPASFLDIAYERARRSLDQSFLTNARMAEDVEFVCRCPSNRAGVRMLMSCLLASLSDPHIDIRKPFKPPRRRGRNAQAGAVPAETIRDPQLYSGRGYDEDYIGPFAIRHGLPVNKTTGYLTPGYRTNPITLTREASLTGKPQELYDRIISLLNDVHEGVVTADDMLAEVMRLLLLTKQEREQRMETLLASLKPARTSSLLSADRIITLIRQHLASPRSARLPVLVVAAAYHAAQEHIGERYLPLKGHTAADSQTKALGDVEIVLRDDNDIVTVYEMKAKRVTREDLEIALAKLNDSAQNVENYIFVTTEDVDADVEDFAKALHEQVGVEFAILDCLGFLRHFLYLFYRLRMQFLEAYQALVLSEPDSAVNQALKEAFLALRLAAEAGAAQSSDEPE
jgi:SacI restriction endonuclease